MNGEPHTDTVLLCVCVCAFKGVCANKHAFVKVSRSSTLAAYAVALIRSSCVRQPTNPAKMDLRSDTAKCLCQYHHLNDRLTTEKRKPPSK